MLLDAKLQSKPCYDLYKTTNFSRQVVDYCFAGKLLSSPRENYLAGKSRQNTFNG